MGNNKNCNGNKREISLGNLKSLALGCFSGGLAGSLGGTLPLVLEAPSCSQLCDTKATQGARERSEGPGGMCRWTAVAAGQR